MKIKDLGYNKTLEDYRIKQKLDSFEVGRVISEHKERYIVKNYNGEFDSELIGNLRYTARDRNDFPAVGDWVAISEYDENKALIHAIYPRTSKLERQAVGVSGQVQIIAANIDFGIIVQAVDRDFNLNRLERYLTICNASKVIPIIVLSKTDLLNDVEIAEIHNQINIRNKGLYTISVSSRKLNGYQQLTSILKKEKTYCLLGSSGVGKSTLLNSISGKELMETGEISTSVNKGRHVTSHRELVILENGAILIDNPGMREVGITDLSNGLEQTFETIGEYADKCKFKDCTHVKEKGCAIIEAVDNNIIEQSSYLNFLKIQRERAHFESTVYERKQKDKNFGKMVKNVSKQRKQNKL